MLEKLITNLKNSLPEPIRKKMGMVDESDEEVEDSEEDELQKYEADDAPNTDAEDKKKKQISMIIRVVVILGIAYFAVDEFVLKKNTGGEQSVDELLANMPVKKKKKKPAVAVDPTSAQALESAKGVAETAATSTPENPDTITDADTGGEATPAQNPPIENVNILDKTASATPESQMQIESPTAETPPEVTETKVIDTSVDKKLDQLVDNVDQSTATTEEVTIPSQPQGSQSGMGHLEATEPKKDTSMASKIVEDVTETSPPAYDQIGRGLVYNCTDKYWACVDKPAYVHCNKNMKWNKSKGNNMECVVQNIYSSDEDCAKIQKYNVSTSVATSFCQGN